MRERCRLVAVALALGSAVGAVSSAQVAWASFAASSSATAAYTSGALAAPTNPAASPGTCSPFSGDRIVLTWTATTTVSADGYEIARSTTTGGPYTVVATVPAATTAYTDGPLSFSTAYYYAIRSTKYTWRSPDATVSRTTRSSLCI